MEGEALAWVLLCREDQAGGRRPISGDRTWGTTAEVGMSVAWAQDREESTRGRSGVR